jgi:hypothetical protein
MMKLSAAAAFLAGALMITGANASAQTSTTHSVVRWCKNHDGAQVDCRELRQDTREIRKRPPRATGRQTRNPT